MQRYDDLRLDRSNFKQSETRDSIVMRTDVILGRTTRGTIVPTLIEYKLASLTFVQLLKIYITYKFLHTFKRTGHADGTLQTVLIVAIELMKYPILESKISFHCAKAPAEHRISKANENQSSRNEEDLEKKKEKKKEKWTLFEY